MADPHALEASQPLGSYSIQDTAFVTPNDDFEVYYHARFHRTRDIRDLDKDIENKTLAISRRPNLGGDPCLLGQLGKSYHCRYKNQGKINDLDYSIKYLSLAVSHSPDGHPHLYEQLATLSISHHQRFHRSRNLDDLNKDIEYKLRMARQKSEEDPQILGALSKSYTTRFHLLGDMSDLESSLEYGTRSVSLTPPGDSNLPKRLHILSGVYRERFKRLGDPNDLDQEIECNARAASLTPQGHPDLAMRFSDLASSYDARYNCLGELPDLQTAIEYSTRALSLAEPVGHSYQVLILANLSVLYLVRFNRFGKASDLEQGIEYNACAFSLTSRDHPLEPLRLKHLGALYHARFEVSGDPDDLDLAIKHSSLSTSLTDNKDGDLADQLYSLGHYVHARWHRQGNVADLDLDISYKSRSVSLTPKHHPELPSRLENLGRSYLGKLSLLKCQCCRRRVLGLALDCFQRAALSEVGPPRIKLDCSITWARTSLRTCLAQSLRAYQVAIDMIPRVVWLGTTISQRYQYIEDFSSLAAEAASTAIAARDYRRALEWLEQGRSIVMNQSLMLRSPLEDLRSVDYRLADRLQWITQQLNSAGSRTQETLTRPLDPPTTNAEDIASRHHQLAKEHAELLDRARKIPGFEDFLKPKQATELISVACTGPIAIITLVENQTHCDALIVLPRKSDIAHVVLPGFTSKVVNEIRSHIGHTMRAFTERKWGIKPITKNMPGFEYMLSVLWKTIAKPILDYLGYVPKSAGGELPHITWCTTGALSFLPLHAAGIYGISTTCVADYAISSYIPSLTSLLSSNPQSEAASLLAVGQMNTPNHSHLPGTKDELNAIQEHASNVVAYMQITDSEASPSAVLDAMEHHDCVHFACHAHQNMKDPTQSGFFLHGGKLDLLSILQKSFKNKGLAFLSACQTASGDKMLPDESIHLASGMLVAGYPSVIATMWSVSDKDAPFVAEKVYSQIIKNGKVDWRESARALHCAILELRARIGDNQFLRWVPFIHMGL